MKYMLDTNICIALIKRKPSKALKRLGQLSAGDIGISTITLAELRYGIAKSRFARRNQEALEEFLLPLEIVDFDENAATAYGPVRAVLESAGRPIGPLDTRIGAHALSLDVVLVTDNTTEFRRIKGLQVDNWLE
ncbi:MAG: type II toxin-antitoxin system VapC family toxin [Candidatus Aminicenantes bacterium]|nr:type II toxin-antitoxin system VapC family toxin [Candidatus Aminicenantes bacterium]